MKIYGDGEKLNLPEYITVSSTTDGITVTSETVNDRGGESVTGSSLDSKQFTCSGVIFADSEADVDYEKHRLMGMLAGKELIMYRTDTSTIFYKCRLAGSIKSAHYNGREIGKAFQVSFTLKSYEPHGYGEAITKVMTAGSNVINNPGSDNVIPTIVIPGARTLAAGTVFSCGATNLKISQNIFIQAGTSITFSEKGLYLINIDYSDKILDESLITPLSLAVGSNTIVSTVPATLIFNPRYK